MHEYRLYACVAPHREGTKAIVRAESDKQTF